MMTTLMATIMIVMMILLRGPASPADSPAVPTPRGLDPISLDRWDLQVSQVDSKLSFSSGGRKVFALDSQGLPMRTNRMTEGDLMRSSLLTPCQKCVSFLIIRNNFRASNFSLIPHFDLQPTRAAAPRRSGNQGGTAGGSFHCVRLVRMMLKMLTVMMMKIYIYYAEVSVCLSRKMITSSWESPVITCYHP